MTSSRKLFIHFLVTAITLGLIYPASAAPGDFDEAFGSLGKVVTTFGTGNEVAYALAKQFDEKIVAAGAISAAIGGDDFGLARYNPDGSLDSTFGSGGKVTTPIGSSHDWATAVQIQSDGKIIAAGNSYSGSNYDFAVVRYNSDGTLDTTFSGDGKVTTAIGSAEDRANAVQLQSDGKIIVAGFSYNGTNNDFALIRYNSDGSLDSSFGTGGIVTTAIGTSNDVIQSVSLQSDGRILVAGFAVISANNDFAVARYLTTGALDTSFGSGGKVTTAFGSGGEVAYSMTLQPDNKAIVAGAVNTVGNDDFGLARYNPDGTLDTSFGTGGKVMTAIGSSHEWVRSVQIQSDGKIIAAGNSYNGSNYDFAVVRYSTDGTLDSTFSGDGKVTTAIGAGDDRANALLLQANGRFLVAGYANNGTNNDFAIARFFSASVPELPTLMSLTASDRRITVHFSANGDGGNSITDYEYSLNGGSYISAGTTSSPFTITGLDGRTSYSVTLKARNSVGLGSASSSLSATTTDATLDASEAAAEVAAAKRKKEQQELTELFSLIPELAKLALNLGETSKSITTQKCKKGGKIKIVKAGAKCPTKFRKI